MWHKNRIVVPDGRETIYEVISAGDNAGVGMAIADIFVSTPHYHRKTAETYTLVSGKIRVHVGMHATVLERIGQSLEIPCDIVHWAESLTKEPARVSVVTTPAWIAEDHRSLPISRDIFSSWENKKQRGEIVRVRGAIREHRDQIGDDRCWLDDHLLYWQVLGLPDLVKLPAKPEFMRLCNQFHCKRRFSSGIDPAKADAPPLTKPVKDLAVMTVDALWVEYDQLLKGVAMHYALGERKTEADDQAMYALLPEQLKADTRHPDTLVENCDRFYEVKAEQAARGYTNFHIWHPETADCRRRDTGRR